MHSGKNNPVVFPHASWLEVISTISEGGLGAVTVIDETRMLLGIITDGDLRRTFQKVRGAELEGLTAETVMTRNPTTVVPDLLAYDALVTMENRSSQISVLPVVDPNGQAVGLIRIHDVVRKGL